MKKLLSILMTLAMTIGIGTSVYAAENVEISEDMKHQAIDLVEQYISDAYEGEYDLLEMKSDVLSTDIESSKVSD